jgi:hypothetical protein
MNRKRGGAGEAEKIGSSHSHPWCYSTTVSVNWKPVKFIPKRPLLIVECISDGSQSCRMRWPGTRDRRQQ